MVINGNQFIYVNVRFIKSVALAATLVFGSGMVITSENDAHEDHTELRIKDMHAKLKITPTQEEQWLKVAQTMLDDAKTMDTLTQIRSDHAKDLTAVDDLKSYGEIVEAHAIGIKKLTPVFADLYASMSEVQKMEADTFFREGDHTNNHKHGFKKHESK